MDNALTITYARPAPEQLDLLMIEQEEWARNTGVVTTAEMLRYVSAWVYRWTYQSGTVCPMENGEVVSAINVYPRVPGLPYQLHTSHGRLSSATGGRVTLTEILNFQLTTEERPQYPCHAIESARWLDKCYDAEGGQVFPPVLTVDGDRITIPEAVYGSVEVRYRTERYTHTLRLPRREDALEEFFSAAVYALYQGGIVWIEIDLPDSFEETTASERCGIDGNVSVEWPEDDPRSGDDGSHSRRTVIDYCSQKILSDTVT